MVHMLNRGNRRTINSVNSSAPFTILSDRPHVVCSCFHRRFTRIAGPPVSPLHRTRIVSLTADVNHRVGIFYRTRNRTRHLDFGSPVLLCSSFGRLAAVGRRRCHTSALSVAFSIAGAALRTAIGRLYSGTRGVMHDNAILLILSSQGVTGSHLPIPTPVTINTVRAHLISRDLHYSTGVVIRATDTHSPRRFTILLNFNTATVCPCLTCRALNHLMSARTVTGSCHAIVLGCHGNVGGNLCGVVSGVNVSAVTSCHYSGLFRTINLRSSMINLYFRKTIDHVNKTDFRSFRRSLLGLSGHT